MHIPDLAPFRQPALRAGLLRDLFLLGLVTALFAAAAPAQATESEERRLRIAFEVSSDGAFEAFVANVEGLQKNFGELADITVVAVSRGVGLFRAEGNAYQGRLARLADHGVDFVVCRESLSEMGMDPSGLLPFARTVQSGYQEIEQLKKQGWAPVGDGESYVSHL